LRVKFTIILFLIFFIIFFTGGYVVYLNYYRTIKHVETTEMNILFSTLNFKVSMLLNEGKSQLLQETLDSAFGYFGLVVTDCKSRNRQCADQQILYQNEPADRSNWPSEVSTGNYTQYPFEVLTSPPSYHRSHYYENSYDNTLNSKTLDTNEKVIGRVYYIPEIFPSYTETLLYWTENPLSLNRTNKSYLALSITSIILVTSIGVFFSGRLSKKEAELSKVKSEKNSLKNRFESIKAKYELNLERARATIINHRAKIEAFKNKTRVVEQKKAELEAQVAKLRKNEEEDSELLDFLSNELDQAKAEAESYKIDLATNEAGLSNAIKEESKIYKDYEALTIKFQKALDTIETYKEREAVLIEQHTRSTLNEFELQLLNNLEKSPKNQSGEWAVLSQFDASRNAGATREIDLVAITSRCVIAIEAKNWNGKIVPEGESLNTPWTCHGSDGRPWLTRDPSYLNPYRQVRMYNDALLSIVKSNHRISNMATYGIVAFPNHTDISSLGDEINPGIQQLRDFYYVTTEAHLAELISYLHNVAKKYQKNNIKWLPPLLTVDVLMGRNNRNNPSAA